MADHYPCDLRYLSAVLPSLAFQMPFPPLAKVARHQPFLLDAPQEDACRFIVRSCGTSSPWNALSRMALRRYRRWCHQPAFLHIIFVDPAQHALKLDQREKSGKLGRIADRGGSSSVGNCKRIRSEGGCRMSDPLRRQRPSMRTTCDQVHARFPDETRLSCV
jgi:hypothetical protein